MAETIALIATGLKLLMPVIAKKLGGKKKLMKAVEILVDLLERAQEEYTSDQKGERKRWVMNQLSTNQLWQRLDEGERDRAMESAYQAWKDRRNPLEDLQEDEFDFRLAASIEALRVHGHNVLADALEEDLGR